MKYLGTITDPKDLTTKKYVDDSVGGVQTSLNTLSGRVDTNEDNIAMAESDIEGLQGDVGTLKTNMTAAQTAITTLQDTYVPNTTKVNGKALSADVTLTASDIGAVPTTRTVNNKALSSNITLTASDVGALPDTTKIPTKTSDLDNDSGFLTSAPVTSVNSKTGAVTLSASDVGALPTTGGTLTGNLKVGSASLGTNGYVVGTWLQGTASNHLSTVATKIAVQDDSGWVYHRTASEVKSDIGAGNTNTYKITNVSVATSSWVTNTNSQAADQEKTDYPFMATISITSPAVTTNDIARVMFGYAEQTSGNFAPNCYTTTNGVIIEAKEKPSATITLDYILIERIL